MNCREAIDALENYVAGDLDDAQSQRVAEHLAGCPACAVAYEETRLLVGELKDLRDVLRPDLAFERVPAVAAGVQSGGRGPKAGSWNRSRIWAVAAAILLVALCGAVTVIAAPSLARAIPLPVGERIKDLSRENQTMRDRAQALQDRVDKLEQRVKELTGDSVNVVPTSKDALPDEVTMAVQQVVVEFIKAQYAGDVKRMKSLATPALKARIDANPGEYLRDNAGTVSFAQMTDVSVYEGAYLTFVRLSDTKVFSDSQYQEDFTVKKVGDRYLVESMEMDA